MSTHGPNAATVTPQPIKASMCTRVNRSGWRAPCVANQDPYAGPGSLYIILRVYIYVCVKIPCTLGLKFEAFDTSITHSKACRNKTGIFISDCGILNVWQSKIVTLVLGRDLPIIPCILGLKLLIHPSRIPRHVETTQAPCARPPTERNQRYFRTR